MYRSAGNPNTVLQRLTLCIEPGKRGKKRGMDIENAMAKRFKQGASHDPHEAGETNQLDVAVEKDVGDRPIASLPVRIVTRADDSALDPCLARSQQSGCIGSVRDYDADAGIELPISDRIDDGLEIRSPAGNENTDSTIHSCGR